LTAIFRHELGYLDNPVRQNLWQASPPTRVCS
jgi:hypothetical protein